MENFIYKLKDNIRVRIVFFGVLAYLLGYLLINNVLLPYLNILILIITSVLVAYFYKFDITNYFKIGFAGLISYTSYIIIAVLLKLINTELSIKLLVPGLIIGLLCMASSFALRRRW